MFLGFGSQACRLPALCCSKLLPLLAFLGFLLPSGTCVRRARDSLGHKDELAVGAAPGVRICSNTSQTNVELSNSGVSALGQYWEDV